jgi:UDP-glucose 4-epimerase
MNILVTGGAGYIGSHTCLELMQAGHQVSVVDNLVNSKVTSLQRVQKLTGKKLTFFQEDLLNVEALHKIFTLDQFDAVIHFAGLKAVGESVAFPHLYYHNNLTGTLNLLAAMMKAGVNNIVFSSSATVYGNPDKVPINESFPVKPTNPYGRTKLMIEEILSDVQAARPEMNVALLRYFNPIGAHKSGMIGEDTNGIPNNLLPYIAQVAVGKLPYLKVYGNDYPTPDGTGIRDYLHVVDLALGHLKALEKLQTDPGIAIYNLGTGAGYSVLEVIAAFEKASGVHIPYMITTRRSGDIALMYADPSLANRELHWKAERNIFDMCSDTWNWQSQNPQGY